MKAISILALALATLAASAVHADEADASQYAVKVVSQRTRAEVNAEAAQVSINRSTEPAGSRVIATPQSGTDRGQVHAAAVEAVRLGQIASGEHVGL
ncbi:MAG: hypothetical protein JWQ07_2820 [Ramlibacter sp.]|nr:hypothetical protein [Ramlibacter sp.]